MQNIAFYSTTFLIYNKVNDRLINRSSSILEHTFFAYIPIKMSRNRIYYHTIYMPKMVLQSNNLFIPIQNLLYHLFYPSLKVLLFPIVYSVANYIRSEQSRTADIIQIDQNSIAKCTCTPRLYLCELYTKTTLVGSNVINATHPRYISIILDSPPSLVPINSQLYFNLMVQIQLYIHHCFRVCMNVLRIPHNVYQHSFFLSCILLVFVLRSFIYQPSQPSALVLLSLAACIKSCRYSGMRYQQDLSALAARLTV